MKESFDRQSTYFHLNKCLFIFLNDTTIYIVYIGFYLYLLHVSAVYFSHRQIGILVHKKSKKGGNT